MFGKSMVLPDGKKYGVEKVLSIQKVSFGKPFKMFDDIKENPFILKQN